jgi:hypothetical protein
MSACDHVALRHCTLVLRRSSSVQIGPVSRVAVNVPLVPLLSWREPDHFRPKKPTLIVPSAT